MNGPVPFSSPTPTRKPMGVKISNPVGAVSYAVEAILVAPLTPAAWYVSMASLIMAHPPTVFVAPATPIDNLKKTAPLENLQVPSAPCGLQPKIKPRSSVRDYFSLSSALSAR